MVLTNSGLKSSESSVHFTDGLKDTYELLDPKTDVLEERSVLLPNNKKETKIEVSYLATASNSNFFLKFERVKPTDLAKIAFALDILLNDQKDDNS